MVFGVHLCGLVGNFRFSVCVGTFSYVLQHYVRWFVTLFVYCFIITSLSYHLFIPPSLSNHWFITSKTSWTQAEFMQYRGARICGFRVPYRGHGKKRFALIMVEIQRYGLRWWFVRILLLLDLWNAQALNSPACILCPWLPRQDNEDTQQPSKYSLPIVWYPGLTLPPHPLTNGWTAAMEKA